MSIPYESGTAFSTATCTGGWIEYPFANLGDPATKVYRHEMMQKRANYAPLVFNDAMTAADEKPSRSPFSDDSAAYWVGDSTPNDASGGNVTFVRTFANVPASRTEGNGLYAFTFPGISAGSTTNFGTSTGNESVSYSTSTKKATFIWDVSGGDLSNYSLGQVLKINNDVSGTGVFQQLVFGNWQNFTAYGCEITDITGSTITATAYLPLATNVRSEAAITTFTVTSSIAARDPNTRNSNSRKLFNYVKSDELDNVSIADKFIAVNSSGALVDSLTGTTVPTIDDYLLMTELSGYILAEPDKVSRWMGNIWQIETTTVLAI